MLFNELPIAFPWYEKIEQQNRYRENSASVCDYKLITPADALLPFQFRKVPGGQLPVKFEIYDINSNDMVVDITGATSLLRVRYLEGQEYFYYGGQKIQGMGLSFGYYYARMTFSDGSLQFSEMFYVPENWFNIADDNEADFLKIEWWNNSDIRPIFYNDKNQAGKPWFRNVVYLDSFITASEPEIVEDGTRDGNDELIPTFQKALIAYRITALVPDFLKKALVVMQLHDFVYVTTQQSVRSGPIFNLKINSALEASGAISIVDLIFHQDVAIVKKGCANNMATDCIGEHPSISITLSTAPGFYKIIGVAPANCTVELWASETATGEFVNVGTNYNTAQLASGFDVPTSDFNTYNFIKIKAYRFGCDFGFSQTINKP